MKAAVKVHQPEPSDPLSLSRYDKLSDEELKAEFAKWAGLSVEGLIRLAALWQRLVNRGLEDAGIEISRTFYLDRIIAGSVLPALVVAFSKQPVHLRKLVWLTPDDQQSIVDGNPVPFVVKPGELRMLPVRALTTRQLTQVICDGAIRDEAAQTAFICQPAKKHTPGKPSKLGKLRYDPTTGFVHMGNTFMPYTDVVEYLAKQGLVEPIKK